MTVQKTFMDDKLWRISKSIAKENGFAGDWAKTVTVYRELGGTNVMVYSLVPGAKRLIMQSANERVLLLLRDGSVISEDSTTVNQTKKEFIYSENPKTVLTKWDTGKDIDAISIPVDPVFLTKGG